MEEKIVIGKSGTKYQNRYVIKGRECELHITDGKDNDFIILVDSSEVERMKDYYWAYCMSGHKNYKRPQIFALTSKTTRLYLHRYITGDTTSSKILFANRNPHDFRKKNLVPYNGDNQYRNCNKRNEKGMNNIRKIVRKNRIVSYQVTFHSDGKQHTKVFNIEKLGGKQIALKAAKLFRDKHTKKGNIA